MSKPTRRTAAPRIEAKQACIILGILTACIASTAIAFLAHYLLTLP